MILDVGKLVENLRDTPEDAPSDNKNDFIRLLQYNGLIN